MATKKQSPAPKSSAAGKTAVSKGKALSKPIDPVELTVRNKLDPEAIFIPQAVKRSIVTMDEVSTLLQDIPVPVDPLDLEQSISNDKNKNLAKISLPDELLESGVVTRPLGAFPRAVLEASLSQLMAGNNSFTSAMLYRTMTGRSSSESVTAEQQRMVEKAMNQLMFTPLNIDLKLYAENGEVEGDGQLRGPIVPAEQIKMNVAGNSCTAYQITNLPIIYRFCMATKGLTMTPIQLLSISNMSYTKRNLAILNDLQRRIAPLIYPVEGEYVRPAPLLISYDSIYEVAKEDADDSVVTPVFKKRVRETVKQILDTWVAGKYLSKWENVTERREFVACKLFFPPKGPPELPGDPIRKLHD